MSDSFLRSMKAMERTAKKATTAIMTLIHMAYCLDARVYTLNKYKLTCPGVEEVALELSCLTSAKALTKESSSSTAEA